MKKIKIKIENMISNYRRNEIVKGYKEKLINKDFTILSSNCNGGFIMHDLGVRFNTPTINLFFLPKDFIKFVKDFDKYINLELIEVEDCKETYPVGKIEDIKIYFQHYHTFKEAKEKWDERKRRINKENLFIMATDRDGCTENDIREFDRIPYKNKVIFTHKHYEDIESAYQIKGFENDNQVGILSCFEGATGKRYIDQFDYVSWLNSNIK
ncbi:hypothetical protein CM240_2064 [Clostridium bornimense]|uniref:Exopolysaccharide biosynthesis protein n=1 Tax=Clostridium bornimense TaxID=1216932 RepID=W6S4F2_9CLOT|nr:DUF1919 domain-containing protein [Clostridium bornimense]CDM69222.1 hypothetical protein CM240_2064 [Clostridium bornimense]